MALSVQTAHKQANKHDKQTKMSMDRESPVAISCCLVIYKLYVHIKHPELLHLKVNRFIALMLMKL